MSLRRTRGYDVCDYAGVALSYNVAGQYTNSQGEIIPGPTAGNAWWIFNTAFGQADYVDIFDAQQTWIVGFHFQLANEGGALGTPVVNWFQFGNSGGSIIGLQTNSDQTISIVSGINSLWGAGVELSRSANPLNLGQWYYLEFKVTFGNNGSFELKLDGADVPAEQPPYPAFMTDPNVNVKALNGLLPDRVTQRFQNFGSQGVVFDNMYVCDGTGAAPYNDFLGPCQIYTLLPTSDQLNTGWTPSTAGPLYPMVNENSGEHPDGDTTFISPGSGGVYATFGMGTCPCTGKIFAVTFNMCARPVGGSPFLGALYQTGTTPSVVVPQVTLAATGNGLGQNGAPTMDYATYQVITTAEPLTGNPWTAGLIGQGFFGVAADTGTNERVTQFYLEVLTSLQPAIPFGCGGPGSYSYGKTS